MKFLSAKFVYDIVSHIIGFYLEVVVLLTFG